MKTQRTYLFVAAIFFVAVGLSVGCSSPDTQPDKEPVQTTPVDPGPECLTGCMLSGDGTCQIEANSMDWNSSGTEIVECDPRCCEAGNGDTEATGPDSDGDGVLDENDECPEDAEDNDQFQDEDGCPDPDNDGDNIPDVDDLCPLDAEDIDGFQDQDGCLDP